MTLLMQEYRSSHSFSEFGGGGGRLDLALWMVDKGGVQQEGRREENKAAGIRLRREVGEGGG